LTNVVVASFADPGSDGTAADYTATITYTDSNGLMHTDLGTIQAVHGSTFDVLDSHLGLGAEEGLYAITVALADRGGSQTSVQSTLNVTDALLKSTGQNFNATTNLAFTGPVATFTDANPYAQASDFTATIHWGDGKTSQGTIAANGNGGFIVTGTHTFAPAGSYAVSVHITDQGGATTTAQGTATVTDSIPNLAVTLTQKRFNLRQVQINGTFSDQVATHHTAVIDWGDGTSSRINLGVSATGKFSLTHTYTVRFTARHKGATIKVSIVDNDGTSSPVEVLQVDLHHYHG